MLGAVALRQIARTGERGKGLAVAAIVLGIVGVAVMAVFVIGGAVLTEQQITTTTE